ncbi:MAG: endolytic transglycosylase MltG [bacterium]|nr:endolytic transglycosylase MltG [bacterium]
MITFKEVNKKVKILSNAIFKAVKKVVSLSQFRFLAIILAMLGVIFYGFFFQAPKEFPEQITVRIEKGTSLTEIASVLAENKLILSSFWFTKTFALLGGETVAKAGNYFFSKPENLFSVAYRIAYADYGLPPLKITIPEGTSVVQIAAIIKNANQAFNEKNFIEMALSKEGYLFPDTYLLSPDALPEEIIEVMELNFSKKIAPLNEMVIRSGKPLSDIIIMASILEEEARSLFARRTIAGILWKRLEIGMPLQVDAVFPYIIGKNTYELTKGDLQIDSPYNTYKYAGLPIGPITNPGLQAIEAALTPIKTDYLYYLSDRSGNMYYAKHFDEHTQNRQYLHKN